MTKEISTWYRAQVLRPNPYRSYSPEALICPPIIDLPPGPVRHLAMVRQRSDRLIAEMVAVLGEASERASRLSVHCTWVFDVEYECTRDDVTWFSLGYQSQCLRWELDRMPQGGSGLYDHEEADVKRCMFAIRNAARALRALGAAERRAYAMATRRTSLSERHSQ